MNVFLLRTFARFVRKHKISSRALSYAANRILAGQANADLGGGVFKQRLARQGQGKSSGFRTLVAHRSGQIVFFVYGFAKNERANISVLELKVLKEQAKALTALTADELNRAVNANELEEVVNDRE